MTVLYHYASDEKIAHIGEGFIDCTLPKPEWTHGAHWAAAFWIIAKRPDLVAERDMPDFIRRYNIATGGVNTTSEGYHETITQASLKVARSFLAQQTNAAPLFETCNQLFASSFGTSNWPLTYWSKELLFSVEARASWVEPDIKPLIA